MNPISTNRIVQNILSLSLNVVLPGRKLQDGDEEYLIVHKRGVRKETSHLPFKPSEKVMKGNKRYIDTINEIKTYYYTYYFNITIPKYAILIYDEVTRILQKRKETKQKNQFIFKIKKEICQNDDKNDIK